MPPEIPGLPEPAPLPSGIDGKPPVPPRTWSEILAEVVLVLPNVVKLVVRLMRDRRVPIRRKALVATAVGYVLSPIDLIPDVLFGIGRLDDVILISLAVDHLMRGTDAEVVLEHWDGSIDALDMVRSVAAWGADILPDSVRGLLPR